ncbi:type VI secretion system-associated protein TagF [Bradyrhizobium cajani]|uniref:Type VI secretion system-associated protein TagF n=1 Tax=Bradyrhizobium cajani TaxID=1928661 RepID=A0A844TM08_9BRAD|nr:type VI secretion system-associated protein TagF [Bradyrhizobium cajani]MCP3368499.1 type VI secretion system-associated protein TagF [Bradyrhizobium cajani]MVT75991.1 type VI secretion system-associated protein TagF [Bradyrhizobium cajani]
MTMRCGLFGKIGAKRDFIAIATPRSFLEAWEPWVQAALSASRHQLGPGWQQAFLTAPVWRFWLGAAICGRTVAGAIMPSLDGVGRYYPLTLHAMMGDDVSLPPPSIDPQDEWFGQAETFLLSTLDRAATFEQISDGLDRLAVPRLQTIAADGPPITSLGAAAMGKASTVDAFAGSFAALCAANPQVYAAASFWWTAGGEGFPPLALSCRGLPDPFHYSTLLTGELGFAASGTG